MSTTDPLLSTLPEGIHARFVENVNGLRMHVLEAGAGAGRPVVLLQDDWALGWAERQHPDVKFRSTSPADAAVERLPAAASR